MERTSLISETDPEVKGCKGQDESRVRGRLDLQTQKTRMTNTEGRGKSWAG